MTNTAEAEPMTVRGLEVRLSALNALIADQELYLAQLKLRAERLERDLVLTRRRAGRGKPA